MFYKNVLSKVWFKLGFAVFVIAIALSVLFLKNSTDSIANTKRTQNCILKGQNEIDKSLTGIWKYKWTTSPTFQIKSLSYTEKYFDFTDYDMTYPYAYATKNPESVYADAVARKLNLNGSTATTDCFGYQACADTSVWVTGDPFTGGNVYGSRLLLLTLYKLDAEKTYRICPVVARDDGEELMNIYVSICTFDSSGVYADESSSWITRYGKDAAGNDTTYRWNPSGTDGTTWTGSSTYRYASFILRYASNDTSEGADMNIPIGFDLNMSALRKLGYTKYIDLNDYNYKYISYSPFTYKFVSDNTTVKTVSRMGASDVYTASSKDKLYSLDASMKKDGYTFKGWRVSSTTSGVVVNGGQYMLSDISKYLNGSYFSTTLFSDVTFTAVWEPNEYEQQVYVRYQQSDGSYGSYVCVYDENIAYGTSVTPWTRVEGDCYAAATAGTWTVTGARTEANKKAVYVSVARKKYTVMFQDYNKTSLQSSSVYYGAIPSKPSDPVRAGSSAYQYQFIGWKSSATGTVFTGTLPAVTGAVTYTAQYTSIYIGAAPNIEYNNTVISETVSAYPSDMQWYNADTFKRMKAFGASDADGDLVSLKLYEGDYLTGTLPSPLADGTITGTAAADSFVPSGTGTRGTNGTIVYNFCVEGIKTYTLVAVDSWGHETRKVIIVRCDLTPPELTGAAGTEGRAGNCGSNATTAWSVVEAANQVLDQTGWDALSGVAKVCVYKFSAQNGIPVKTIAVSPYQVKLSLSDYPDEKGLVVKAWDNAGNTTLKLINNNGYGWYYVVPILPREGTKQGG